MKTSEPNFPDGRPQPAHNAVIIIFLLSGKAIQRCKQDLEKQIQQNLARSEEERRDAEARKEHQRKLVAEHEAHQLELKESSRKKLLVRSLRDFAHAHSTNS